MSKCQVCGRPLDKPCEPCSRGWLEGPYDDEPGMLERRRDDEHEADEEEDER